MKLEDLIKMTEEERSALKKSVILEAFTFQNSYEYRNLRDGNEQLNRLLAEEKAKTASAKEMLVGYLGLEVDKDEWSFEIDTKKLILNELIGKAIAKGSNS